VKLIDLSHRIEAGMITYKGLPAPIICDFLSRAASRALYDEGAEFSIQRIEMVGNTGTYLDSPFHRYADGADLAGLKLEQLANLDAVVIDAEGRELRWMRGRSMASIWPAAPCWCGPGGIGTGAPTPISRITRSSPPMRRRIWRRPVRHWSGSIATISTTRVAKRGRCTRSCLAGTSRFANT